MGDQLLPLSLTERSVHLCVDGSGFFRSKVLGRGHGLIASLHLRHLQIIRN